MVFVDALMADNLLPRPSAAALGGVGVCFPLESVSVRVSIGTDGAGVLDVWVRAPEACGVAIDGDRRHEPTV